MFEVDDDVGTCIIADLSVPSEEEEEEVKSNNVWKHAIDMLFKLSPLHPDGKNSVNGSIIKPWMIWGSFTNGTRNILLLENFLHPTLRTHGIKLTQIS